MYSKYSLLLFIVTATFIVKTASAQNNDVEKKITALISKMTLEEKVGMIHASSSFTSGGVKRLGIPEIVMSDGPHGVRVQYGRGWSVDPNADDAGTYLPTGNALGATWNTTLGYSYGNVLGSEAKYRGKDVILGPGINIIRSPLNGRNFEYLSEDPFLISKMVVGYIKGVQGQGISASVKHFIANNEEVDRGTVDVRMSERALREIYLPGFKAAVVEGGVNTLMGAYNKFRGQYATHNSYLINTILKKEWNFKGFVMSDWGSVHSTYEAIYNGTDLEMGTDLVLSNNSFSQTEAGNKKGEPRSIYDRFFMADSAIKLIRTGGAKESLIDDKVRRILRVMFKTNMIDGKRTVGQYNTKEHQQLALKVAEEGIVLLKNTGNLLPLSKGIKSIAIIGQNAVRENSMGGGSSQVKAKYEVTPLQGIKNMLGSETEIQYEQGYKIARGQKADQELINAAVNAAKRAQTAIIFCGWTHGFDYNKWDENAYDAEGVDKPDMHMPFGQDELIKAVLKANPNTIIVLMGGGSIDISEWKNEAKAILEGWYPGMEGGHALAKIIFGDINPSGKLPFTFPKKLEDSPAHKLGDFPGVNGVVNYKEDIFVGYRYFDTYKVEPEFAFGHGLSYTSFSFSNLRLTRLKKEIVVEVMLTNTGQRAGAEVVQVYAGMPKSKINRAEKELKAFQKVFLNPGQTKKVKLFIAVDDLRYFDEGKNRWNLEHGKYQMSVGNSSAAIMGKRSVLL